MKIETKNLPKSLLEITFELSVEEMQPYLEIASSLLQTEKPLNGFRTGKAPLSLALKTFGEMTVWERAAEEAIEKTYSQAVLENQWETIGSPQIDIIKLAPDNPFIFKATVPIIPEIKLADFRKIKVKKRKTNIEETKINKVLEDLRKMQAKEVVSSHPLKETGKVVVDMEIFLDGVPVEGGQAKNHAIYMDEDYYLPGLKEKLLGIKKNETREFKLSFPKNNFHKHLAGREADFKITAKEIYELEKPPLDDAFAQSLGQKTLFDLRVLLRRNLEEEQRQKDAEIFELEILEKAIENSRFGDLPEILINEEVIKMLHEFKDGIIRQGLDFEDYLQKIGKDIDQLKLDFAPEAVKRVKTALLLRQIAKEQKLQVTKEEIETEINRVLEIYKDDEKTQEKIRSPESQAWLENFLRNRKAINWLKETVEIIE
jgi:trigger factor